MTSFRVVQEVIQYLVICLNRTLSCIIAIVMTHTPYIVILNKQNTKHKRINANYNSQGGLIPPPITGRIEIFLQENL